MILPCIACGKELKNVDVEAENQPYEGLAFRSPGHYGGTVFDPMDGRFLEVNVCDDCLVRAAEQKNVLVGQDSKLVVMPGPKSLGGMPSVIGTTPISRELVPWDPEVDDETTPHMISSYEDLVETRELGFVINTRFSDEELSEMFERREGEA